MPDSAQPPDRIIKRQQIQLLSVAEGFCQSAIVFALLRLQVFEHLADASLTVEQLAVATGADSSRLGRLLNAGVMLHLLELDQQSRYRVPAILRSVLLPTGGEHYLGDWLRNMDLFRDSLARLLSWNFDRVIVCHGICVDTGGRKFMQNAFRWLERS